MVLPGVWRTLFKSYDVRGTLPDQLDEGGAEVWDLGLCSTDMVTFVAGKYGIAGGVMVTASHNPPQWNGFKCCERGGFPLSGQYGLDRIVERIISGKLERAATRGKVETRDLMQEYVQHLLS